MFLHTARNPSALHRILAAFCLLATWLGAAVPTNMKLFLLMGQSNMAGRGTVEAQDTVVHPRVYKLYPDASQQLVWTPSTDPVHFDKSVAGVGPASSFARQYADANSGITVGLIPCAYGGTSMDQWLPTAAPIAGETVNLYNTTLARARQAMANGTISGILWNQGESDSSAANVATYPDRFATMIAKLREDLAIPNVPVIAGEIGRFYSGGATYNPMLPDLRRRVPLVDFATSEDLTANPDNLHYNSASQRTYGSRYLAVFSGVKKWLSYEMETRNPVPVVSAGSFQNIADTQCSNASWTKFSATAASQYIQANIYSAPAGSYAVSVRYKRFNDRGSFQFSLDGTALGGVVDQYKATSDIWETHLGNVTLGTQTSHTVRFTVSGKNAASSAFTLSIDAIILKPIPALPPVGKVVVIKADDFRGPTQAWTNFLAVSRSAGIKVSIGVIATSTNGNSATSTWMKSQEALGDVEFWNHGWDHLQWTNTSGVTVSEFQGSGVAHQRENLALAQASIKASTGHDAIALGTGYNGYDADTATVINETPALRVFFAKNVAAARAALNPQTAVLDIISESDGTGIPNAAKFQTAWELRPANEGPVSLQFHPPNFSAASLTEYQKILQYLLAQGCTIQLPSELVGGATPPSNPTGVYAGDGAFPDKVVVGWSTTATATTYEVWRGTGNNTSTAVRIANGLTSNGYTDTTATDGTGYYYWVKALNAGGTSGFSAPGFGFRGQPVAPPVPEGVNATSGTFIDKVRVGWIEVSLAAGYEIWRNTADDTAGSSRIASGLTGSGYDDTTALADIGYYYWIKATNANGAGGFSSPAAVGFLRAPLLSWRQEQFGASWNDAAIAGNFVDADGDGVLNLWEYVHGTSATNAASFSNPQGSLAGNRLTLSFPRSTTATDVTLVVQDTDTLSGAWSDLATSINGAAFAAVPGAIVTESGTGASRTVVVSDPYLSTDPLHPRRFLRLKVEP